MGLRSMVDRIYNEDYYSLLHKNYKGSGPFREDLCFFFYVFLILYLKLMIKIHDKSFRF